MNRLLIIVSVLFYYGCEPFVNEFSESYEPIMFHAENIPNSSSVYDGGVVKVLTWNIRFGSGRFPFFGDSCGEGVLVDDATVQNTMESIACLLYTSPSPRDRG